MKKILSIILLGIVIAFSNMKATAQVPPLSTWMYSPIDWTFHSTPTLGDYIEWTSDFTIGTIIIPITNITNNTIVLPLAVAVGQAPTPGSDESDMYITVNGVTYITIKTHNGLALGNLVPIITSNGATSTKDTLYTPASGFSQFQTLTMTIPYVGTHANVVIHTSSSTCNSHHLSDDFRLKWWSGSPLSVSLVEFGYDKEINGTIIYWKSGTEKDFDHYELQASNDGISFYTIYTAYGLGDNNNYSYNIGDILSSYYRLEMIDDDGRIMYSNILNIHQPKSNNNFPEIIYDMSGRKINEIVAPGIYIIKKGSEVRKIYRQ